MSSIAIDIVTQDQNRTWDYLKYKQDDNIPYFSGIWGR